MRKILIASHRGMADGLKDTLMFLTGMTNIESISAYMDNNPLSEQIQKYMSTVEEDDEVFVFTDMLGGSVNQEFCSYRSDKVHLICGMNLPLIMAIALHPNDHISKQDIAKLIEEARNQILYMNEFEREDEDEDE